MKFKFLSTCMMSALAAVMMTGCSSDDIKVDEPDQGGNTSEDAVYMNVTVQLPGAANYGRSSTGDEGGSTDGEETGNADENLVKNVVIVFANNTDLSLIAYGEQSTTPTADTDGTISSTQKISKSALSGYYGEDETLTTEEQTVRVFVFCNATSHLKQILADNTKTATWFNEVCRINETPTSIDNSAIWGGENHTAGFLMSSANKSEKKLPATLSAWSNYSTPEKAFKLSGSNPSTTDSDQDIDNSSSPIKVERSVARFDFKDGSTLGNCKYNVVSETNGENTNVVLQVQLTKMGLVNMSNSFYYLRRTSDDGTNDETKNPTIGGTEIKSNYVVDADAAEKADGSLIKNLTFGNNFNFPLWRVYSPEGGDKYWAIDENARKQWYVSTISDVLNGRDDIDEDSWGSSLENKKNYKIWRYVTENTIPGPVENEAKGITTGVVFKAKFVVPDDADINSTLVKAIQNATGNSETDEILYYYGNNIYVTWREVRAAAIEAGTGSDMYRDVFGTLKEAVPAVGEKGEDGKTYTGSVFSDDPKSPDYLWNEWHNNGIENKTKLAAFKDAAVNLKEYDDEGNVVDTRPGFTLYQSSLDNDQPGYYCYYYYWNRHNDNGNNGLMSPMEFAVVRNNIYKLAVTNIKRLGHPRISDNDPDPEKPDDPDESGDVYIDVDFQILHWTVRVNNIEF